MREIKFRAWDKKMQNMGYLNDIHDTLQFDEYGSTCYYNLQNGSGGNEYELMQYTGLKDKNGKEIYEGDILGCNGTPLRYVKYSCDFPGFDLISTQNGTRQFVPTWIKIHESFEVIGNVYENSELLEV